jgi:hypothetical protein
MIIYKYPLQAFEFDATTVEVPEGEVLKCDFQHGVVYVWIAQDDDEVATQLLRLVPTGKQFDDTDMRHVGSAVTSSSCWHVYRVYY